MKLLQSCTQDGSCTFGTAFHVSRNEMGGNTEATRRPITKNSQFMSMPILMRMIDHTPENSAKTSTESLDTMSICTEHPQYYSSALRVEMG